MDKDLHERWLGSVELSFAWRVVPDDDLQAQYTSSGDNFARREFVIAMMKSELVERLLRGEYAAVGVRAETGATAGLEILPAHFFARSEAVNWDASIVSAFGRVFEEVRIPDLPRGRYRREEVSQSLPREEGLVDVHLSPAAPPVPKGQIGRPRLVPLLQVLITEMAAAGRLDDVRAMHRISLISAEAKHRYPDRFIGDNSPAPNTVRKALRAAGYQVGAEVQKGQKGQKG